jgi:predicted O-linked N-acetylglucosamine transferase (SPINDLY family)
MRERWDESRVHFTQALAIEPGLVAAQRGLCEAALRAGDQGSAEEAIEALAQTFGVRPEELAHLRGRAANLAGRTELADDWLTKAITYQPSHRGAWAELARLAPRTDRAASLLAERLGLLGQSLSDSVEKAAPVALSALLRAELYDAVPEFLTYVRTMVPNPLPLYDFAARVLYHARRTSAAERVCRASFLLPNPSAPLYELAAVISAEEGRAEEARQLFAKALRINPADPSLLTNVAHFLLLLRDTERAIFFARRAAEIPDESGRAHIVLGEAYHKNFQLKEALETYKQAFKLPAVSNLTRAALWHEIGRTLFNQGNLTEANDALSRATEMCPEGSSGTYAFTQLYRDDVPGRFLTEIHRAAGAVYDDQFAARRRTSWSNPRSANRRLRVGFVSADMNHHPVGLLLVSWLPHVDPDQFELYAYDTSQHHDAISDRIAATFSLWRNVHGDSADEIADQIDKDGIDILIDLSGHTDGARLDVFALKPAPVQLSWAGYVFSTGMKTIDGVIHDRYSAPPESDSVYVERILRLPCMTYCYVPFDPPPPVVPTPALERGYITFGCFNHVPKLTHHTLKLWARVLRALPTARLHLKAGPFADATVRTRILARLQELGVDGERVRIEGMSPFMEYLAAYDHVDIALDTYPFNGGVTSLQGLWQGVPVLTRAGPLHLSRVGGSMMHALNLSSWVAETDEQFVAAAIAKALDFEQLNRTRLRLRERLATSTLGNGRLFAARMEQLWRDCWYRYCRGSG